jgi:hypothetical protein
MPLTPLTLRLTIVIALSALLFSCSDDEVAKGSIKDPEPGQPLPENACAPQIIYGYCNKVSYTPSEKVIVYLQGSQALTACRLNIYNLQGDSIFSVPAKLIIQTISTSEPSSQGFGFTPTAEISLPSSLPSGMYMIEKTIPFIVKPKKNVDLLVVYPSNTANAYASSGGSSLYTPVKAKTVSFLRPIALQDFSSYCMKWFSTLSGKTIGYIADIDLDSLDIVRQGKILILVGHNEYWTRTARKNFDRFVDEGGHALVLSGNTMWWQVRYTDDRTGMICYKSLEDDPIEDPLLKTFVWTAPSLQYPIISSIGADFEHGGYGLKTDAGWDGIKITSPHSPLLQGLNLKAGDILKLPSVETDGAPLIDYDERGFPIIDKTAMGVDRAELIGFDKTYRNHETAMTFIVLQRSKNAGIIINTGSTDWCSANGMGGVSGDAIKQITRHAINKLLAHQEIFSEGM